MLKLDLNEQQLETLISEIDYLIRQKEQGIEEMTRAFLKTDEAYWGIRIAETQEYRYKLQGILRELKTTRESRHLT